MNLTEIEAAFVGNLVLEYVKYVMEIFCDDIFPPGSKTYTLNYLLYDIVTGH